jgi:ketosteroid isomerase-like protein
MRSTLARVCFVLSPVAAISLVAAPGAPAATADQAQLAPLNLSSPQHTMDEFFKVLNSYDAPRYEAMLTEDATIFFVGPPLTARRVQGREAIMQVVKPLFDVSRAQASTQRSQGIQRRPLLPQDMMFQTWRDTSVVTFDIPLAKALDRRTFVLRREHGEWKIAHLHASAAEEPRPPAK